MTINIIITVADLLLGLFSIAVLGWGAYFFGRWWILLFTIIPLTLYNSHSLILDADIESLQKGGDTQDG